MKKIVAIACSTGGPKALQQVVPYLDDRVGCPVLIVQHMPNGFTKALADRLNMICKLPVCECEDREIIQKNKVYIAKAGLHMKVEKFKGEHRILLTDEPTRLGVKPCADYMYESLAESGYDEIICVVLTGMGSDGADGIEYLKSKKKVRVLIQNRETCVVFGMPGSVLKKNSDCIVCNLANIGNEIIKYAEG